MALRYRFEPLNEAHPFAQFNCGDEDIDGYLHDDAMQQQAYGQARTTILIDLSQPAAIAGFFTLRAHSLRIDSSYFDYLEWRALVSSVRLQEVHRPSAPRPGAVYPAPARRAGDRLQSLSRNQSPGL